MFARNDSPSPEWYEPADIIDDDEPPAPINRPTISVTEKGARLLALLRCREILPASATTVAAALDWRIACLLDDVGAD